MLGPVLSLIFLTGLAAATPLHIRFRNHRGLIWIDATLEGSPQPMRFILDSGAGETVIAKHAATELGLPLTGTDRIRTVHGTESASRADSTTIHIGTSEQPLRFSTTPLVIDLASESRSLGSTIDGLLGADFFHGRSIKIDFKHSCLHLSPAGRPSPRATRLPLFRSRGAMFVGLTAANSPLQRVRLDTGCCRSLCWSPPATSSVHGVWRDGNTIKIAVKFGSLVMSDVPTDVYRRPLFPGEDGLLGTALLSRFDSVWIDAINDRITFDSGRD